MKNYPRNHAMDFIRSSAMIAGIIFHASLAYVIDPISLWPVRDYQAGLGLIDFFVWFSHRLRMPLFYFVSGFFTILLLNKYPLKNFVKKRILRVFLPFVFGFLVIIPLSISAFQNNGFSFPLNSIIHYKSFFHLWFLLYLLIFYSFFIPLRKLLMPLHEIPFKYLILFQIISISFLHFLMKDMTSINPTSQFRMDFISLTYYFLFFIFGTIFFKKKNSTLKELKQTSLLSTTLALSIIIPILLQNKVFLSQHIPLKLIVDTLTSIFVVTGIYLFLKITHKYLMKERKKLRYISDSSYWLYLWHIPLIVYFQHLLKPIPIYSEAKILINTSITCLILLTSYHLFVRYTFIGYILHGKRDRL